MEKNAIENGKKCHRKWKKLANRKCKNLPENGKIPIEYGKTCQQKIDKLANRKLKNFPTKNGKTCQQRLLFVVLE